MSKKVRLFLISVDHPRQSAYHPDGMRIRLVRGWYADGTRMVRGWYADGTWMVRGWYADGTRMVRGFGSIVTRMVRGWYADTNIWILGRFQKDLLDFQSEWAGNGLELMAKDMRTQPTSPNSIPTSRPGRRPAALFFEKSGRPGCGDGIRRCRLCSHILCHQLHPISSPF